MKIIAIIPARGGSKGVSKKNIRLLADKPLIHYTIRAAQHSNYVDHVIVSTDDDEIINVASTKDVQVIKRPPEISDDDAPTIDAILHLLDNSDELGLEPDLVVLLQPTSPFRTTSDIDAALDIFLQNDCDSIISVVETTHPPYWNMVVKGSYLQPLFDKDFLRMRRQDLPRTYIPNGAIYIASAETLKKTHSFYTPKTEPYIMPAERSLDIDSEFDLLFAEALMKHGTDHD